MRVLWFINGARWFSIIYSKRSAVKFSVKSLIIYEKSYKSIINYFVDQAGVSSTTSSTNSDDDFLEYAEGKIDSASKKNLANKKRSMERPWFKSIKLE